ncbi:MarR family winged helix-turn-helix transcriptional regulator [Paractinoplanes atraurantiacus]|uniref:DNA-binding transcriptional regulator, MarR family n=1 Tax=Paractinoplanes atraurantiacus TaxID=1036182 RepID=A0A285I9Y7_9ACTN|nr:MarR family transcriptional regulator [Actinoplanes atraurantiacus]SNY44792.1 DNA-binding transcriptional regulator, MarR family [Actinoplanes atraurantiacus]
MAQGGGFGDMLVWLSVVIQRRHAQICADHDLTPAQAQLLCVIKERPQRMAELAASMGMSKNALSQLVDRTERRGLVQRESPERDRRVITLDLTPVGRKLAESLYADVADRLPDIAGTLSPADQRLLERLATTIAAAHIPTLRSDTKPR